MTRYRYNEQVQPPAPFVHVTLQRLDLTATVTDVPAQLDTGADLSVVPAALVEQLGLVPFSSVQVSALGGIVVSASTFLVRLQLRGQEPVVTRVLGSAAEPHILLGRDILNRHRLLLDGPRLLLEFK